MITHMQGPALIKDASPTCIARMIRGIFKHERRIRGLESLSKSPGRRFALVNGERRYVTASELAAEPLKLAREARDEHIDNVRHVIDYALTVDAYEEKLCPDCQLPTDGLDFARSVGTFEAPAIGCKTCKDARTVRVKKADAESAAAFKRISYFKRVLDDTIRCAKIRMGTSDANQAYLELEAANIGMIHKFGNEAQTSLEGADAEQGARQGIIDAARRFDPTRKEGAMFNTVAYNWCRRNSRARHWGQKRAGVYAPSVDAMKNAEGEGVIGMLTSAQGALSTFEAEAPADQSLKIDVADRVAALPDLERQIIGLEMTGLSVAQIARKLGMNRATIMAHHDAAYSLLRQSLGAYVSAVKE